jgi:methylmalonyl-CoA carboxyltransferase large subunit
MGLLLLPLGIFAGWIAGAAMSRRVVREELERLGVRQASPALAPAVTTAQVPVEEVSPDTILVLSAAVAAFLGKRARVRSARLVRSAPSNAWAQQGRAFVQGSHNLGVVHGR